MARYISKSDETLTVVVYYNENNGKVWVQDVAEFKNEYEACEDE